MRKKEMAEIREVLYQKTKKVTNSKIAKNLGISRTSVRKYVNIAESFGFNILKSDIKLEAITVKVYKKLYELEYKESKCFAQIKPLHHQIGLWLEQENITHTQINRKLTKHGITVSDRTVNRYIKAKFPHTPKATIHITTVAGEEAQVDYGYVGLMKDKDGNDRKVYAFVMTLSHSRYRYVEFVLSQDQISWCQSHINAFNFFGAVPKRILLDNLKAGVIKPDIYDPIINKSYQELSHFYGFVIDPAKSAKPEHKGKVEKSVHIVKQQLIAACHYHNIGHANTVAINWCSHEISQRICSSTGRTPNDLFKSEDKPNMLELRKDPFDLPEWTVGKVHNDHHLVIQKNFYSVPKDYIGKDVNIRIGLKSIQVYSDNKLIKTHIRSFDKGQWITDVNDYHDSAKHYIQMFPLQCLQIAQEIGAVTLEFIQNILSVSSRTNLRKAQALLRLRDHYSDLRIEAACLRCIAYDNYDYKSISRVLETGLDKKNTPTFSTKVSPTETAYIRPANSYSSSMEVNL